MRAPGMARSREESNFGTIEGLRVGRLQKKT